MDAVMTFLLQSAMLAVLISFFVLIAVAAYAVVWSIYHMMHDHWTPHRLWDEALSRLRPRPR